MTRVAARGRRRRSRGAARVDGFHVERWVDLERAYVAVSDIDAVGSGGFVEAFRAAAGDGGRAIPSRGEP